MAFFAGFAEMFFKVSKNVNHFLVIADNAVQKVCILLYPLAL